MKENVLGAAVLTAILASGALSACSDSPKETTTAATETQATGFRAEDIITVEAETTQASAELKGAVVGASPTPHVEILNTVREVLASKSYELKTMEYTDYVQPNNALGSGDPDADHFQHELYLDPSNEQSGTSLINADTIHYEPSGAHAGKTASLGELPGKAAVLVPNDVSNRARALLLLEVQGLIKPRGGVGLGATRDDIVENTKSLDIVELEVAQLLRSVSDGGITVINGNYATRAGLKISDALATEDSQPLAVAIYSNVMVVREGGESSDVTKTLVEALTSSEVKQFMEGIYEGVVVLLF